MKTTIRIAVMALLALGIGGLNTAFAQTVPPRPQPTLRRPLPKPKPKLSNKLFVRADGFFGVEHFNASQTFKGIFGSANGVVYGGGVDIVKGHLFVRADVSHFGKTGERVFDANGQVFRLGIPLDVSITPVVGAIGVRGLLAPHWIAYAGGGAGSWSYSQTGDDPADAFSVRKTGYLGLGGVEWRVHPLVGIGFEAQYARVPNAFSGGLAQDLNESDLGGATAVARVIVGRF